MLDSLIAWRKEVRNRMESLNEKDDPLLYKMLNILQNLIKIVANSLYGGTGASEKTGMLPMKDIAETVTHMGRFMITQTQWYALTFFNRQRGFIFDADVVYGDTDSVFIRLANMKKGTVLPPSSVFLIGIEMAEAITKMDQYEEDDTKKIFKSPIKLEFEKFFPRILLTSKKRYAGDKIEDKGWPNIKEGFSVTGMEILRYFLYSFPIYYHPSYNTTIYYHHILPYTTNIILSFFYIFPVYHSYNNLTQAR
jgi:DNA polymerase delta subunit 1